MADEEQEVPTSFAASVAEFTRAYWKEKIDKEHATRVKEYDEMIRSQKIRMEPISQEISTEVPNKKLAAEIIKEGGYMIRDFMKAHAALVKESESEAAAAQAQAPPARALKRSATQEPSGGPSKYKIVRLKLPGSSPGGSMSSAPQDAPDDALAADPTDDEPASSRGAEMEPASLSPLQSIEPKETVMTSAPGLLPWDYVSNEAFVSLHTDGKYYAFMCYGVHGGRQHWFRQDPFTNGMAKQHFHPNQMPNEVARQCHHAEACGERLNREELFSRIAREVVMKETMDTPKGRVLNEIAVKRSNIIAAIKN
ncbi:hypothetical protein QBC39DRAFT_399058 [Podospora conica]|nr:hypothetical protein QBC39DRAFT_399058 [Schizothecium conicum]